MTENKSQYLRWEVPEYRTPERDRNWYLITGFFVIICLFFCFFTISNWKLVWLGLGANFLFALILIIAAIIMILNKNTPPLMVSVEFGPEGLKLGNNFYSYNKLKHFIVLYKPKKSLKQLYIEFKNPFQPRLSIPLRHKDALDVRNFLVKYLEEDLERTEPPVSEQLTKMLKL